MRSLPAPMARRIENSFSRADPRARSNPATLMHAMSRIKNTDANSNHLGQAEFAFGLDIEGTTTALAGMSTPGYCACSARAKGWRRA